MYFAKCYQKLIMPFILWFEVILHPPASNAPEIPPEIGLNWEHGSKGCFGIDFDQTDLILYAT